MEKKVYDLIIIGAGASGMMAAITASERGLSVMVIERLKSAGKKILATGNGQCNYTNEIMNKDCFRGNEVMLCNGLEEFGHEDLVEFFKKLGVFPYVKNGYFYPRSRQAASVVTAMERRMNADRVLLRTDEKVAEISRDKATDKDAHGFKVKTDKSEHFAKNVLIATGLKAQEKLGSDGSGMELAKKLGHHMTKIVPALCGFNAKGINFKEAAGVRTAARVSLSVDGREVASDEGEIQFADYGISGIVVFQLSRYAGFALADGKEVKARIDIMPDMSLDDIVEDLLILRENRIKKDGLLTELSGLVNSKLIRTVIAGAGLSNDMSIKVCDDKNIEDLALAMKSIEVELVSSKGFDSAQICAGGIVSDEVDSKTLESKLVKGLYFSGEILDVDGICGGYNLQWAFSSGYLVGKNVEV